MRKLLALLLLLAGPALADGPILAVTVGKPIVRAAVVLQTATLTWTYSTVRTDGTPVIGALTARVWQGTTGAETLTALSTTATTLTVSGTWGGTKMCWTVDATDTGGITSAQSNEACKTFSIAAPLPPTGLSAT